MNEDIKEIKKYVQAIFWLFFIQLIISWVIGVIFGLKIGGG